MSFQPSDARFIVRDYRAADFDRLWQIDQLCFPDGIAYTQMELNGFIMKRNAITLVAEGQTARGEAIGEERLGSDTTAASRVAGFAVAHAGRGKIARILTLDIAPHARRFGLASRLMEECERRLRAAGCSQVVLETAVNNEPALRLYRKLGYRVVRTLPKYYSSHALDAFLMTKRL